MKIQAEKAEQFIKHCNILASLARPETEFIDPNRTYFYDGLKIYEKLLRIENRMHRTAEQECNGTISEEKSEKIRDKVRADVAKLLPNLKHFTINGDPRGYALKIDDKTPYSGERGYIYELRIHTDFGGFGILAPDFD